MDKLLEKLNTDVEQLLGLRVAIYGTGNNARRCFPVLKKLNIVCFLDGQKNFGRFEEFPILSIEEAINLKIDVILISTELIIEKIIYDRISVLCEQHNIKIFGIYGGYLIDSFSKIKEQQINSVNQKDFLINLIDHHDTISFDIFDTLLMRKTMDSEDVFDIVDLYARRQGIEINNFKMTRMRAGRNVLSKHGVLSDIYDEFQRLTHIDDKCRETLEKIELDVERKVLISRQDVVDCYNYAISNGKKVYIISDMYLESDFLKCILEKNGITGFEKIYVSEEQKTRKSEGLFNKFIEEFKITNHLHIGDNYILDGLFSCVEGIDSYILWSGKKIAEETRIGEILPYLSNSNEKNLMGLVVAKLFNSPFMTILERKIYIENSTELIVGFISPIEITFTIWIINRILKKKFKKILFAARDGLVFEKLYRMFKDCEEYRSLPESIYFYTSRTAAVKAAVENELLFQEACKYYGENIINKMLNNCTSLADAEIYKKNYFKYMNKNNLGLEDEYAFIDLTSCGTTQYYLDKIGLKLKGFYLDLYLGNLWEMPDIQSMIYEENIDAKRNLILETFIGATEPMVEGFDSSGEPVFSSDRRTEKSKKLIEENCLLTEKLAEYFISNMYDPNYEINPKLMFRLIDFIREGSVIINPNVFKDVFIDDGVWGGVVKI